MYNSKKTLFLICETPLHAGTGSDLGIVDLPIQRERHTGFPKVEASGLKGSIKDAFRKKCDSIEEVEMLFGREPDAQNAKDYISAIGMIDARLLLFPVRSMKGVFAWVTCPKVLQRFKAELELTGTKLDFEMPTAGSVPQRTDLLIDGKIILEEYRFDITEDKDENEPCTQLANWLSDHITEDSYWQEKMKRDIVVLRDDDFRDFVTLSTEVITRTRINPATGTVDSEKGALFTEEFLPMDTVMYTLIMASPVAYHAKAGFGTDESVMEFFCKHLPNVVQIGGNATLGKGLVRTNWV